MIDYNFIPESLERCREHTGYYAYFKDGLLTIGYDSGREGGVLYRGEYKGENTPFLGNLKAKNRILYNSIIEWDGWKEIR